MIGDGYCDDFTNNVKCDYDGGDCCGNNKNTNYCIDCECKTSEDNCGILTFMIGKVITVVEF